MKERVREVGRECVCVREGEGKREKNYTVKIMA